MESDDTNESDDSNVPGSLAREIELIADDLPVGDASAMLASVHAAAKRRRRRRNAVLGLAAAATLLVTGVVVAQFMSGNSGDDMIVSAPVTEPVDTEPVDTEPTDTEPVDTEPTSTEPVSPESSLVPIAGEGPDVQSDQVAVVDGVGTEVIPSAVSVVSDPEASTTGGDQNELFPWKDGVLAIRTTYPPQPLPGELPTDVVDAFPPEVQELFPDGLPPTIDEAIEILQEADLLDEVTQILSENAAVSDAIYSQPSEGPVRTVRSSPDGVEWTDIDSAFPATSDGWYAASTGERFVFVRNVTGPDEAPDAAAGGTPFSNPVAIEVHSSTNLVDWSVQTVPVPERPADLDPRIPFEVFAHSLAATDSGFVVAVDASAHLDYVELLEPEVRDRIQSGSGGYSMDQGAEGVSIGIYESESGELAETLTFTWAELGFDSPQPIDGMSDVIHYAGTWDGAPAVATGDSQGWLDVRAVGDVFVRLGPDPQWSIDGVEWTPVEGLDDGIVEAAIETSTGVAVRTSQRDGTQSTYVGEDLMSGEWTPLSLPELPDGLSSEVFGSGAFLLSDYGEEAYQDPYADAIGSVQTAEVDGYEYRHESLHGTAADGSDWVETYTLTDIATGEVVATETGDPSSPDGPFEYLDYQADFGNGLRILDPESGDALVTMSYDELTHQIIDADGTLVDPAEFEPPDPTAQMMMSPEYWILASVPDGWLVQNVSDGGTPDRYPSSVVSFGDGALVAWGNGEISRVTAT
ncbi:hypothetical protein [Ilumatobacter nonamiensis]|uniref:hypothetical protein n=1 Tax=Ilumatobacter nonamiensis TaxID=467093 RepID=UPI000346C838|nr:hypothetical protein [Ilumatobacter nonamiensis]